MEGGHVQADVAGVDEGSTGRRRDIARSHARGEGPHALGRRRVGALAHALVEELAPVRLEDRRRVVLRVLRARDR